MTGITDTYELAPGIHRVETIEDEKLHGYHVLEGPSGPIIVDPGYKDAPTEVYKPFLEDHGWSLQDVGLALITHADADHFGGNHSLRTAHPSVTLAAHVADVPLIERVDRIMTERYAQFEDEHGITYDADVIDWLTRMMGPDEHVDLGLRGGEKIRVRDRRIDLYHTPGHTQGHLMLHDREHDLLIGGDGFFGRGLFDVHGTYLQPPPYYLYPAYETTIDLASALAPELLSFTHSDVLRGDDIEAFIDESLDFVTEMRGLTRALVQEQGPITLREAIDAVVDRKGSFGLDLDLAFPLTAHLAEFVENGRIVRTTKGDHVAWEPA